MLILWLLLAFLAGSAAGGTFVRRRCPRVVEVSVEVPIEVPVEVPVNPKRKFCVMFWTDSGAAARTLWEKVRPNEDGVMEFYGEGVRRSIREQE